MNVLTDDTVRPGDADLLLDHNYRAASSTTVKVMVPFIYGTNVYWLWLILAKDLSVNYFSPESTLGVDPGVYWMNVFNKYLMSSGLGAGEIRTLSKHLQFSKHRKSAPPLTICWLDIHGIPKVCSVLVLGMQCKRWGAGSRVWHHGSRTI